MRPQAIASADVAWLVESLWPLLDRLANAPAPDDPDWLSVEVRHRLGRLVSGLQPVPDAACHPPLVLVSRGDALDWGLVAAQSDRELEDQVRFALVLLWHSSARTRVARCHGVDCLRFFLRPEVRGRPREHCSQDCARPAHLAYVRQWRRHPKRRTAAARARATQSAPR